MSPDAIFLIPTVFGVAAAAAFYAFAKRVGSRHSQVAAAKEEASAPFEQSGTNKAAFRYMSYPGVTSMYHLGMKLRRATTKGPAVSLTSKSSVFSVRRKRAAREKA